MTIWVNFTLWLYSSEVNKVMLILFCYTLYVWSSADFFLLLKCGINEWDLSGALVAPSGPCSLTLSTSYCVTSQKKSASVNRRAALQFSCTDGHSENKMTDSCFSKLKHQLFSSAIIFAPHLLPAVFLHDLVDIQKSSVHNYQLLSSSYLNYSQVSLLV